MAANEAHPSGGLITYAAQDAHRLVESRCAEVSFAPTAGIPYTVECSATPSFRFFAPSGVLSTDCDLRIFIEIIGDEREERSTGSPRTLVADVTEVWVKAGIALIAKHGGSETEPADIWCRLVGEPRKRALTFIRDHHETGAIDAVLDAADDPFAAVSLF